MKSFAAIALAGLLAQAAFAQNHTFVVNPDASEVKMTLNTTHEVVVGTFHIQAGSIEFDRGNSKMAGSVIVVAGSGSSPAGPAPTMPTWVRELTVICQCRR